MGTVAILFFFTILVVSGVFLVLIPFVPAIPYMMIIATVFKLTAGSAVITSGELLILLSLTALSVIVDWSAGLLGAKYGGAHLLSMLFGLIGSIVGLVLLPPFGGIVGLFLGILGTEFYRNKNSTHAINAASGALFGTVVGMMINFCIASIFAGLFIFFTFFK